MIFISVKEVVEKAGIPQRTVERAVANGKYTIEYINGVGRGGKQLRIALESLPQDAQDRYYGIEKQRKEEQLAQFSNDQLHYANEKLGCVNQYWQSGLSPEAFVLEYNQYTMYKPITTAQLFNWQRIIRNGGGLAELVDRRGGYNKGETAIPAKAWQFFYDMYMTTQKRGVAVCYDYTSQHYPDVPDINSFYREVAKIPEIALRRWRDGKKAADDKLPSMKRGRLDISSNQIWFSDHHTVDVLVKAKNGKLVRPILTTFYDARSNNVVGHLLRPVDADQTAVKQCFRIAAEQHGVPDECYFDNGADYKAASFNKDYPMSLVKQIGMNVIYATPYHGQAKTVERFFGTFEGQFGKLWPTYLGSDTKKRPDEMRKPNKKLEHLAPTFEEFSKALDNYMIKYNNTPSRGQNMDGKSPNEVYFENLAVKRVVANMDALRILCGNCYERTVRINCVSLLNNEYTNDELLMHQKERVYVMSDPANIDKVMIFDMECKLLCEAKAKCITPFRNTTQEEYKQAAKEKKAARAMERKYKPTRELSVHEIIARNQFEELGKAATQSAANVEQLTPLVINNANILTPDIIEPEYTAEVLNEGFKKMVGYGG